MKYKEEMANRIVLLQQSKQSPIVIILRQLMDMLIEKKREDNDLARGDEFILNQGEIRAYKGLIGYIEGSTVPESKLTTVGEMARKQLERSY